MDDGDFLVGLLLAEGGAEYHLCEQVEGGAKVIAQGGCVEGGFLLGGIGIDLAANALDMIDDLTGSVMFSPLEDALLYVVCHDVLNVQFVASTRANHDAYINDGRSGLAVDNLHTVG